MRDTLTFERIDCRDPRVPCFRGSEELPTPYLVKAWTGRPITLRVGSSPPARKRRRLRVRHTCRSD